MATAYITATAPMFAGVATCASTASAVPAITAIPIVGVTPIAIRASANVNATVIRIAYATASPIITAIFAFAIATAVMKFAIPATAHYATAIRHFVGRTVPTATPAIIAIIPIAPTATVTTTIFTAFAFVTCKASTAPANATIAGTINLTNGATRADFASTAHICASVATRAILTAVMPKALGITIRARFAGANHVNGANTATIANVIIAIAGVSIVGYAVPAVACVMALIATAFNAIPPTAFATTFVLTKSARIFAFTSGTIAESRVIALSASRANAIIAFVTDNAFAFLVIKIREVIFVISTAIAPIATAGFAVRLIAVATALAFAVITGTIAVKYVRSYRTTTAGYAEPAPTAEVILIIPIMMPEASVALWAGAINEIAIF